jgi:hypothetical protein
MKKLLILFVLPLLCGCDKAHLTELNREITYLRTDSLRLAKENKRLSFILDSIKTEKRLDSIRNNDVCLCGNLIRYLGYNLNRQYENGHIDYRNLHVQYVNAVTKLETIKTIISPALYREAENLLESYGDNEYNLINYHPDNTPHSIGDMQPSFSASLWIAIFKETTYRTGIKLCKK